MKTVGAILEAYFDEHVCRHCGERPPMPKWRCCRQCWVEMTERGWRPAPPRLLPETYEQPEPVQLAFFGTAAA